MLRIVNLIENTEGNSGCIAEHGLSFYVETEKRRLLVDTGASDAFLENACRLGIELSKVDTVVLSHGHYDHAGGIPGFVKKNSTARIFIHEKAKLPYYHSYPDQQKYIGISPEIAELPQVIWVSGECTIDEELQLFSDIRGRRLWPAGNDGLTKKVGEDYVPDTFDHEQCLVISCEGKRVLMSGCAHNGVLNILSRYRELYGGEPDVMISGFHMKKQGDYTSDEEARIVETARQLHETSTRYYTGHCTGEYPFALMKNIMGERLTYVHSGDEIIIE